MMTEAKGADLNDEKELGTCTSPFVWMYSDCEWWIHRDPVSKENVDDDAMGVHEVGPISMGSVIRKGDLGMTYKGYHQELKQMVAVKRVDLTKWKRAKRKKQYQKLQREIQIMQDCNHCNIVNFVDYRKETDSKCYLTLSLSQLYMASADMLHDSWYWVKCVN